MGGWGSFMLEQLKGFVEKGLRLRQSPSFARLACRPTGSMLACSHQAHNLPLRTACMSQIMPHPLPQGVSGPTHYHSNTKKAELYARLLLYSSGKRDSDPRPRPWQGRALPTELFPRGSPIIEKLGSYVKGLCREKIKIPFFLPLNSKNPAFTLKKPWGRGSGRRI